MKPNAVIKLLGRSHISLSGTLLSATPNAFQHCCLPQTHFAVCWIGCHRLNQSIFGVGVIPHTAIRRILAIRLNHDNAQSQIQMRAG